MNKQFDVFVKMKIKEISETISNMTYAYLNPETSLPTIVPSTHYKKILEQPVEAMVNEQVKKQFLNIMYKQMKALKDEEPSLFMQTLLLMDLNKNPDSLSLNEEVALKVTAEYLLELAKEQKKSFHLLDNEYLDKFEDTRDDSGLMANLMSDSYDRSSNIYKFGKDGEVSINTKKKDKGMER